MKEGETMKQLLTVMMVLALFLPMISCAEPVDAMAASPADATKAYTVELSVVDDQTTDAEGKLLAAYRYEIPVMTPVEGAPETVQEVADAFNGEMQTLLHSCMETGRELGTWGRQDPRVEGNILYYCDELTAAWQEKGSVISITFQHYEERLGPHPNTSSTSYLFDMERGRYINPLELADDRETFRTTVEQRILEEIQEGSELRAVLYDGYEDTVADWNDACVSFEEELVVTFSTYMLAPHAAGPITFRIPYEEAGLGAGGLARLGVEAK